LVFVWKLGPLPEGKDGNLGFGEQGTRVSVWIKERGSNRHLEKTSAEEYHNGTLHKSFCGLAQLV
jgi:hypothetical protein